MNNQDFWINRRNLRQDIALAIHDKKTREHVMLVIDAQPACDLSERDQGKEPILKDHESLMHEYYADGSGAWKSSKHTDWTCPTCGWFVGELLSGPGHWHVQGEKSYCSRCGQRIDWTKPSEEEWRLYEERKAEEEKRREKEHEELMKRFKDRVLNPDPNHDEQVAESIMKSAMFLMGLEQEKDGCTD